MNKQNLSFHLPVVITKQGKSFVAYTPALDLSTSAKTQKEVKKRFAEVAEIFLTEITENGTAHDVLSELGWTRVQKRWSPPKVITAQSIGLSIPSLV